MYRGLLAAHRTWSYTVKGTPKLSSTPLKRVNQEWLCCRRRSVLVAWKPRYDYKNSPRTLLEQNQKQSECDDSLASLKNVGTVAAQAPHVAGSEPLIERPISSDENSVRISRTDGADRGLEGMWYEHVRNIWRTGYSKLRWINDLSSASPEVRKSLELHQAHAAKFLENEATSPLERTWNEIGRVNKPLQLSILVGALARSANDALTVLNYLVSEGDYAHRIQMDCLFYLRNHRWEEIQADPAVSQKFWSLVQQLRDTKRWPMKRMRDSDLDLILQNTGEEEQQELLTSYTETYADQPLQDWRLLTLVGYYTRLKDVDRALECLGRVSPEEMHSKNKDLARRCTDLLMLESVQHEGHSHSFKILPALLKLGFSPDDLIYDIAMHNAIKFDLPAVTWDIFRYAQKQDVSLSRGTYHMLLRDSYRRRDADAMNELLSIIQRRPELYQDPPIVAYMINIIRSISIYERGSGPAEAQARMLAFYDKAYTRAPLARIGLLNEDQAQQGNMELPEPDFESLAFMVFSFVMAQTDVKAVDHFWQKLTTQVKQGDQTVLEACKHTAFYDGFLCFYARAEIHIPKALRVLRHMLDTELCLPGDVSWSIVVKMFLRHGKDESAEKVRQMMLRRGHPVTYEAWQHILEIYPYTEVAQEVRRILDGPRNGEKMNPKSLSKDGTTLEATEDTDVTSAQSESIFGDDIPPQRFWSDGSGLQAPLAFTNESRPA